MRCFSWIGLRNCSFIIGVVYSLVALAVASATFGFDSHVAYDDYASRGFNTGAAIVSFLTFLSSISLVYGIFENRREFVSPWLVMQIICFLFTAVFYFWAIAPALDRDVMGPIKRMVPEAAVFAGFHITVMIGCIIVVHKYYQQMEVRSLLKYNRQMSGDFDAV